MSFSLLPMWTVSLLSHLYVLEGNKYISLILYSVDSFVIVVSVVLSMLLDCMSNLETGVDRVM